MTLSSLNITKEINRLFSVFSLFFEIARTFIKLEANYGRYTNE